MTWLDSQKLWKIARNSMSGETQKQLHQLLQHQAQRSLTAAEQEQLESLRQAYGRITLRKARLRTTESMRWKTDPRESLTASYGLRFQSDLRKSDGRRSLPMRILSDCPGN